MAKRLRRTKEDVERGVGHGGIPIVNALWEETDRGCALTSSEFLSDALEAYIGVIMTRRGADKNELNDFLLNLNAPLGNLSPRIKAAYWFGLIGPKTFKALENIRSIRNQCAHRAGPIDFTDSEVENDVRALDEYLADVIGRKPHYSEIFERYFGEDCPQRYGYPAKQIGDQRRTFMKAVFDLRGAIGFCTSVSRPNNHGFTRDITELNEPGVWW